MHSFFSHGKLLLTGEYLVLDGAKALAVPTKRGQSLRLNILPGSGNLHWTAKDSEGNIWLNISFILQDNHLIPVAMGTLETSPEVLTLKNILECALALNPDFLNNQSDYEVITHLQFANNWGLGSSSTLINNIAQWSKANAMTLFYAALEGSGYDIALAIEGKPIVFELQNGKPEWKIVSFNPPFLDKLYFVHLGNKQNSRNEIANYRKLNKVSEHKLEEISRITRYVLECTTLEEFEELITKHENLLAEILKIKPLKESRFSDYPGAIKSLGAWGGDFFLATRRDALHYFSEKGYQTVLDWEGMIN